jgi:uncharacterized membrane protein
MTIEKRPSYILLHFAYACMGGTFVTGLLWVVSLLIAWQLLSKTNDPVEKKHCRWIMKSNFAFIAGVGISLPLLLGGQLGLSANIQMPAISAILIGVAIIVCVFVWYFYRTVRGMMALYGSSQLPNT